MYFCLDHKIRTYVKTYIAYICANYLCNNLFRLNWENASS